MEILITLAAGAALIVLGLFLIHRLNAQHDARIAAHRFGDPFPAVARPPGHSTRGSSGQTPGRRRTGIRS
ncbi:hypothetical protein C5L38_17610 [Streptomyces sp. WAC00288]|uniref:hypothetical protein n=1 Tax=unclassified Streptomyces TaxID=2593676 RepID=UPI000787476A|nr:MULTISPECIES: hypothetical protein [unclassified Streptomyces]AVH96658.1 hypothetical protein C5L38_17610 [Streptomyces sp. WAC00288]KYG55295.1 hypothetical protein AWI43_13310 [Streptomyces sp. WAC04657]